MYSIFTEMDSREAAAWIAGMIAIFSTLLNLWMIHYAQTRKQKHEVDLESIRISLAANLETYKAKISEQQKLKDMLIDGELERLKDMLRINQQLYAASIPEQQRVRDHMSKTRSLLLRVYVSFDRLAHLAPSLKEENVLVETTNTLDLYAEYRQHISSAEYVSYPSALQSELASVQNLLTRIFLDLQIDEASRNDPAMEEKMEVSREKLNQLKISAIRRIEQSIRIRLDSLQ